MFKVYASLAVALMGAMSELGPARPDLAGRLFMGYIFWALFWGVPACWRWWTRSGTRLIPVGGGTLLDGVLRLVFTIMAFVGIAYIGSVLVVGPVQFFRHLSQLRRS